MPISVCIYTPLSLSLYIYIYIYIYIDRERERERGVIRREPLESHMHGNNPGNAIETFDGKAPGRKAQSHERRASQMSDRPAFWLAGHPLNWPRWLDAGEPSGRVEEVNFLFMYPFQGLKG